MKRIDLHIHTHTGFIPGDVEPDFSFSLETLKSAIDVAGLEGIAITNHNYFDLDQFKTILNSLEIPVFPGIEVSADGTHILIISPGDDLVDFSEKCEQVTDHIESTNTELSMDQILGIFSDLSCYLVIPHFKKKPRINPAVYQKWKHLFNALEVHSMSHWSRAMKNNEITLPPVLFSDFRASGKMDYPVLRATYVDCNEFRIPALKAAFLEKNNVSLNQENDDRYVFLPSGIKASSRLNVIVGGRSTGKSHLLNNIELAYGAENVRYIRQFDLAKEAEEEEALKSISISCSADDEEYRQGIKALTSEYMSVREAAPFSQIKDYLSKLQAWGLSETDEFSKCAFFSEDHLHASKYDNESKLYNALVTLLESNQYREEIDQIVAIDAFLSLLRKVILDLKRLMRDSTLRERANRCLDDIQNALEAESETPEYPSDFNIVSAVEKTQFEKRFYELVEGCWQEKVVNILPVEGYRVVSTRCKFNNASKLAAQFSGRYSFGYTCKKSTAREYIDSALQAGIKHGDLYRALFDIVRTAEDDAGNSLSGGQWSELLLLSKLYGVKNCDALLIDEPEASFDNPFLCENIITRLRKESENTPVFLATHNNSLGVNSKADIIMLTVKAAGGYDVLVGKPTDGKLVSPTTKNEISTYDSLMDTMEAGETAYLLRRDIYEGSKN